MSGRCCLNLKIKYMTQNSEQIRNNGRKLTNDNSASKVVQKLIKVLQNLTIEVQNVLYGSCFKMLVI